MTNDPVRDSEQATDSPSGWTPTNAATPQWMGTPPPSAKAIRTPRNITIAIVLSVVGLVLLLYGLPAVILHVRASMGDGWPPEGNFGRAGLAFSASSSPSSVWGHW